MHQTIDKAKEYLIGACSEMLKPKSKTTHYNDFFTVNDSEKDKVYSPVYQSYIEVLDYVPQLLGCIADKKALTALEKAKIGIFTMYPRTPTRHSLHSAQKR